MNSVKPNTTSSLPSEFSSKNPEPVVSQNEQKNLFFVHGSTSKINSLNAICNKVQQILKNLPSGKIDNKATTKESAFKELSRLISDIQTNPHKDFNQNTHLFLDYFINSSERENFVLSLKKICEHRNLMDFHTTQKMENYPVLQRMLSSGKDQIILKDNPPINSFKSFYTKSALDLLEAIGHVVYSKIENQQVVFTNIESKSIRLGLQTSLNSIHTSSSFASSNHSGKSISENLESITQLKNKLVNLNQKKDLICAATIEVQRCLNDFIKIDPTLINHPNLKQFILPDVFSKVTEFKSFFGEEKANTILKSLIEALIAEKKIVPLTFFQKIYQLLTGKILIDQVTFLQQFIPLLMATFALIRAWFSSVLKIITPNQYKLALSNFKTANENFLKPKSPPLATGLYPFDPSVKYSDACKKYILSFEEQIQQERRLIASEFKDITTGVGNNVEQLILELQNGLMDTFIAAGNSFQEMATVISSIREFKSAPNHVFSTVSRIGALSNSIGGTSVEGISLVFSAIKNNVKIRKAISNAAKDGAILSQISEVVSQINNELAPEMTHIILGEVRTVLGKLEPYKGLTFSIESDFSLDLNGISITDKVFKSLFNMISIDQTTYENKVQVQKNVLKTIQLTSIVDNAIHHEKAIPTKILNQPSIKEKLNSESEKAIFIKFHQYVSNLLNNDDKITPENKEKITEIIKNNNPNFDSTKYLSPKQENRLSELRSKVASSKVLTRTEQTELAPLTQKEADLNMVLAEQKRTATIEFIQNSTDYTEIKKAFGNDDAEVIFNELTQYTLESVERKITLLTSSKVKFCKFSTHILNFINSEKNEKLSSAEQITLIKSSSRYKDMEKFFGEAQTSDMLTSLLEVCQLPKDISIINKFKRREDPTILDGTLETNESIRRDFFNFPQGIFYPPAFRGLMIQFEKQYHEEELKLFNETKFIIMRKKDAIITGGNKIAVSVNELTFNGKNSTVSAAYAVGAIGTAVLSAYTAEPEITRLAATYFTYHTINSIYSGVKAIDNIQEINAIIKENKEFIEELSSLFRAIELQEALGFGFRVVRGEYIKDMNLGIEGLKISYDVGTENFCTYNGITILKDPIFGLGQILNDKQETGFTRIKEQITRNLQEYIYTSAGLNIDIGKTFQNRTIHAIVEESLEKLNSVMPEASSTQSVIQKKEQTKWTYINSATSTFSNVTSSALSYFSP